MNTQNMTKIFKGFTHSLSKHSPEILTGVGIAGMITTSILVAKATPKALQLIEDAEYQKNIDHEHVDEIEKLTPIEVVRAAWKPYIPAAITCVTSIACLIGASSVHVKRNAALATVYKISETAINEYKEKVVETIGEKKEQVIREKIHEDRMKKDPVGKSEIILTEKGNTLCYDSISGRYFKSDIDKIKRAENELNKRMLDDMYISLNELYDELGLGNTSIGDLLGWNLDQGLIEIHFSSQLAEDGTPCVVIDYNNAPKYDFSSFVR